MADTIVMNKAAASQLIKMYDSVQKTYMIDEHISKIAYPEKESLSTSDDMCFYHISRLTW